MKKKTKVNVNRSVDFEFSLKQAEELDIVKEATSKYHILYNNEAFKAELLEKNFNSKAYTIVVNQHTYQVKIANPLDQLINDMGFSMGISKKLNDIKAPMPGIIVDIEVKAGDPVKEGDTLVILEAMKMENAITSPKDGRVKSVLVKTGDTVEKSKLLIELA